jgi:hypothetical protein
MIGVLPFVRFYTVFALTLFQQGHAYHFKKLTEKSYRVLLSRLDFLGGLVFRYVLLSQCSSNRLLESTCFSLHQTVNEASNSIVVYFNFTNYNNS